MTIMLMMPRSGSTVFGHSLASRKILKPICRGVLIMLEFAHVCSLAAGPAVPTVYLMMFLGSLSSLACVIVHASKLK